jgi:hypothetical protein
MPMPGTNELPDATKPLGTVRLAFCTISAAIGALLFTSCVPPWPVDLSDAAWSLVLAGWLIAVRVQRPSRPWVQYFFWFLGAVQILAVLAIVVSPGGPVQAARPPEPLKPLQAWNALCGVALTGFIITGLAEEWRLWRRARQKAADETPTLPASAYEAENAATRRILRTSSGHRRSAGRDRR